MTAASSGSHLSPLERSFSVGLLAQVFLSCELSDIDMKDISRA